MEEETPEVLKLHEKLGLPTKHTEEEQADGVTVLVSAVAIGGVRSGGIGAPD